jgi:PAS domain S-box-containing protein
VLLVIFCVWRDRFVRAGTAALRPGLSLNDDARALLDASPDSIFVKDRTDRVLFANRAYAASLGVSPEALVGCLDTDFRTPTTEAESSLASSRALDGEAMAGRTVTGQVGAYRDGAPAVFDVQKDPLRDANGQVFAVITHARDATRVRRAEEAVAASEARYRLLLEHAPVSIYVHDGQNVLFANRAFGSLMGAGNPTDLVGYPVARIAHPDEFAKLQARVRAVAAGQLVSPSMEFRAVRLDGGIVPVSVMATKCVYEERPAIQVVMIDETERLRAQSERQALEVQLRHAQRLDALGTLAGGTAHDFNNMLSVILASAEFARDELPPGHEAQHHLEELLMATERAAALVRGILAFSRKQPLDRAWVQLSEATREAVRLVRATLPSTITLEVEAAPTDSGVIADATQVHQVLMNLCTNAAHAMDKERPGHIRVRVETVEVGQAAARAHPDLGIGRYVCVSVRDNGVGMDPLTAARVFDPFFTTKAAGAGTGLGLSVVHGILRGHGGAVTVSSEPGHGTEFCAWFPAAEPPVAPEAKAPPAPTPHSPGSHVLLVDDEVGVLSVTRRSLERLGLRVSAHATLQAALAALRGKPDAFDVIVTDHNMTDGTGLDLAQAARLLRPELPVILMSGFVDNVVSSGATDLAVRVVLNKPFSIAQLKSAIDEALGGQPTVPPPT